MWGCHAQCRVRYDLAMPIRVRDITRLLAGNGFVLDRQRGSHQQWKRVADGKTRLVTIAGEPNDELPKGTLNSIVRQSGLPKTLSR